MGILNRSLKASTLIEVLVAMVIIMASIGIGLIIYENLSSGNNDELKIKAEIALNNLATETKKNNHFIDLSVEQEDMRLQQTVVPYEKSKRLISLHLEAFTPFGRRITQWDEIVLIP